MRKPVTLTDAQKNLLVLFGLRVGPSSEYGYFDWLYVTDDHGLATWLPQSGSLEDWTHRIVFAKNNHSAAYVSGTHQFQNVEQNERFS